MKRLREQLLSAALHSVMVITLESVLSGALLAAVLKLMGTAGNWHPTTVTFAALIAGIILALVLLITLIAFYQKRVVIPHEKFSYIFENRRFFIDYADPIRPVYKRRYRVKSLVDDLERIVDHYSWTGAAAPLPVCTVGDCEVIDRGHSGLFTVIEIEFPSKLKKNKTIDIELAWYLDNSRRDAEPFLSMTVTHPTSLVEFEVRLPHGAAQGSAYLTSCPHIYTRLSNNTVGHQFHDDHVTVTLSNPRLYSHNELRWKWQ